MFLITVKFRDFFCSFWFLCGTVFEPDAVISSFEDVLVMNEPVGQSGRHFSVAKHTCPLTDAKSGGDYDALTNTWPDCQSGFRQGILETKAA